MITEQMIEDAAIEAMNAAERMRLRWPSSSRGVRLELWNEVTRCNQALATLLVQRRAERWYRREGAIADMEQRGYVRMPKYDTDGGIAFGRVGLLARLVQNLIDRSKRCKT